MRKRNGLAKRKGRSKYLFLSANILGLTVIQTGKEKNRRKERKRGD